MGAKGFKEKKQKHLIYSSIRMEINVLCLLDTPPVDAHFFFFYHRIPAYCLSQLRKFKVETCGDLESHRSTEHCHLRKSKWKHLKIKDYYSWENS